jgi:hypothetical protein
VELRRNDVTFGLRSQYGRAPNKNKEGWFGFSLYFPKSFVKDSIEESIVEWQALPDFSSGEQWRSAPLFLGVVDDRVVLEIRTDDKKVTEQYVYKFTRIDLGPLDKEVWSDWVMHIRWAYDNTGIVEVWKDKQLVVSRLGMPNSYNDATYPYLKVGINKWDWEKIASPKINVRAVYVDEVTIGNEISGFDKVNPARFDH